MICAAPDYLDHHPTITPSLSALCAPLAAFFTCTHHLATRRRKLFSRRRRQHCLHASCCRPQPDRTRIWFVFASRRRSEGENCTRPSESGFAWMDIAAGQPLFGNALSCAVCQNRSRRPYFHRKFRQGSRRMSAENWSVYLILCETARFIAASVTVRKSDLRRTCQEKAQNTRVWTSLSRCASFQTAWAKVKHWNGKSALRNWRQSRSGDCGLKLKHWQKTNGGNGLNCSRDMNNHINR